MSIETNIEGHQHPTDASWTTPYNSAVALAIGLSALYSFLIFLPRLAFDFHSTSGASTDVATHYYYAKDYFEALSRGILLPSWASSVHGGLGSPVLLVYPPLFYFTTGALTFITGDIYLSMILLVATANFLSGLVAYQIFRRMGLPSLGLVAAFVIQLSPLAHVTDTAFAAWPTYFAVPFALLFFYYSIYLRPDRLLHAGVALAAAVLCLAHILTASNVFICTGIASAICAAINLKRGHMQRNVLMTEIRTLFGWAISTLTGVGLACFYVIPALNAMPHFAARSVDTSFPWFKAFLLSPVSSLQYGLYWPLVQVILPGVTALFLIAACWALARSRDKPNGTPERQRATYLLVSIALLATFFMTELSYPLWKHVHVIRMNLLPARLLQLASVATMLAFVLAWWTYARERRAMVRFGLGAAIVIPTTLTFALAVQFYVFDGKPRREYLEAPASTVKRDQAGYYRPKYFGSGWQAYVDSGGLEGMCRRNGLVCETVSTEPNRKAWQIESRSSQTVELPLFWFPNWKVKANGIDQHVQHAPASGVITLQIPAGVHFVEAIWDPGPDRALGIAVSIGASIVCLIGFVLQRRRPGRSGPFGAARAEVNSAKRSFS